MTLARGEKHPKAKHPDGVVEAALALYDAGMGYKLIAQVFEVPVRTVRDWVSGRTRSEVPDRW